MNLAHLDVAKLPEQQLRDSNRSDRLWVLQCMLECFQRYCRSLTLDMCRVWRILDCWGRGCYDDVLNSRWLRPKTSVEPYSFRLVLSRFSFRVDTDRVDTCVAAIRRLRCMKLIVDSRCITGLRDPIMYECHLNLKVDARFFVADPGKRFQSLEEHL